MTRADVEPLRACFHRARVRQLLVHALGFELDPRRALAPLIEARILSVGAARTRYLQRAPRCRSLDALTALGAPERCCAQCLLRTRCTAQLRLDLIVERRAWRLLLERTSAKRFLNYHAQLHRRAIALEDIVHRIVIFDRGSWGEIRFSESAAQGSTSPPSRQLATRSEYPS